MNATFLTLVKPVHFPVSCSDCTLGKSEGYVSSLYTRQPKRQALQMNYFIACSARIHRNMKCFHQWLIVYFTNWSNQTTKCLEWCSWSYAGSWITGGSWTDKGWGASCTTDNHKSTDTCKPSQADKMQVQDVWLLAKLLLQQHRTCLHRRVLLHGIRWSMWEPLWSDLCQWLRRKQWRE